MLGHENKDIPAKSHASRHQITLSRSPPLLSR